MSKYKIELKWALIFFIVTLFWMIFEKLVGLHGEHIDKHQIYTNFFAIPAILVYVFALVDKRKSFFQGFMTWKQGFISGLIITIIVAFLSPLIQIFISTIISPEYFPNMIEYSVNEGYMKQEAAEEYFSLSNYIMQGFIGSLIMGVVTSAVVSIFVKKSFKVPLEK